MTYLCDRVEYDLVPHDIAISYQFLNVILEYICRYIIDTLQRGIWDYRRRIVLELTLNSNS